MFAYCKYKKLLKNIAWNWLWEYKNETGKLFAYPIEVIESMYIYIEEVMFTLIAFKYTLFLQREREREREINVVYVVFDMKEMWSWNCAAVMNGRGGERMGMI